MSERDDPLRLADIADQVEYLENALVAQDKDAFLRDQTLQRAVAFALQVIGEAANKLSPEARAKAPDVPWARIVSLRNHIAHGYFALEQEEIWRIATVDAPRLRQQLRQAGLIDD